MKKWIILATALGGFSLALGVLMWQQGIRATAPALGFQTLLAGEEQAAPLIKNYQALPENTPVTRLVVHKNARQLWAFNGEQLLKIYPVSLGRNPMGHKQFEGDGKTPKAFIALTNATLTMLITKISACPTPMRRTSPLPKRTISLPVV